MGQYRLWLHYREVDRQLHSELELLEEKLAALQEQAGRLQATASTDNVIIQALQAFLRTATEAAPDGLTAEHAPSNGTHSGNAVRGTGNASGGTDMKEQTTGAISRALFAWSSLPKFDTHAIPALNAGSSAPVPPDLRPEADLSPAHLAAILARRDQQSIAQPGAPGWLANLAPSTAPGLVPVDQQSTRTDLLVQRWLERWRRRSADQHESEEDNGQ